MVATLRYIRKVLSICLVLMTMNAIFVGSLASMDNLSEDGLETYNLICQYIDQGDAKSAVDTLLEARTGEEVYAYLSAEVPVILESILVEAACFYNEDGELFNIADLRLKGFFSDELFGRYWERIGVEMPKEISEEVVHNAYDVYLFNELLNWYERGDQAITDIVDLRWLGMIEDVLYVKLVEEWNIDLMDKVDVQKYIPLYGMRLSEEEKEQIRTWLIYVDEGKSREAANIILSSDSAEDIYRWLLRNDVELVEAVHAQAMFENACEGTYEQNLKLILSGYVSDACFECYWRKLDFVPGVIERSSLDYQNVDMYFLCEMERICALSNNSSTLLKWLWNESLIDEYTFDLLVNHIGGWESN